MSKISYKRLGVTLVSLVVESETNAQLAEGGVVWVVDVGHHEGDEPDDLASDINAIAVNPLPPLPPAPLVPLVPAVPFQ